MSGPIGSKYDDSVVFHRAENVVNEIRDNSLIYSMDRPPTGLRLEGIGHFGDSGSPALLRNPDTGLWNVGGVMSWGGDGVYGDENGYTRLGGIAYKWIMKNLAFNKRGKPKPWKKFNEDKCYLFKPEDYDYDGSEGDDNMSTDNGDNDGSDGGENDDGGEFSDGSDQSNDD